jgi:hypothetical protein
MKKRHARKRPQGLFNERDAARFRNVIASDAIAHAKKGRPWTPSGFFLHQPENWRLLEKMWLVVRLLQLPGEKARYRLAKVLVAEGRQSTIKSAERQIDDAIATVRQAQEVDSFIIDCTDIDDAVAGRLVWLPYPHSIKYGIRYTLE